MAGSNPLRYLSLVRGPSPERDQVIRARDAAIAERDLIAAEKDQIGQRFIETYNVDLPATPSGRTANPTGVDDAEIVKRIIAAYQASLPTPASAPGFWDSQFFDLKRPIHDALVAGDFDTVQSLLRDPARTDLFYGFDNLARTLLSNATTEERVHGIGMYQELLQLSEALGARRLWLPPPEADKREALPDVDTLLCAIDRVVGFRVDFPNPFPDEVGLATSRGVASYRAVQALYQARRLLSATRGNTGARVVEIGAGLGRTALYARRLGMLNYTIVDLPISAVAQAYFLGRALGPDEICLYGEDRPGIRILPPGAFLAASDRYDVAMNVDSLTEMAYATASAYCEAIKARAALFISISHEQSLFTARDVCAEAGMKMLTRTPYWLRRGYVDEEYSTSVSR